MNRIIGALALAAWSVACGGGGVDSPERTLVVVSLPPQKYVVERVAGDLVDVEVLIPPGAIPETYEPSMEQLKTLERASLYVEVGHPAFAFESVWIGPLLEEIAGVEVVKGSEGLEVVDGDPHLWLSPTNVDRLARNVAQALVRLLPHDEKGIDARLEKFTEEIAALDREIGARLAPVKGRTFLVFHPAWGYFAREYGLVQRSIERERKDPDPRELAELIDWAEEAGADVVFVQPQLDPVRAEWAANEFGARMVTIDPLAYDWAENLRQVSRVLARELDR